METGIAAFSEVTDALTALVHDAGAAITAAQDELEKAEEGARSAPVPKSDKDYDALSAKQKSEQRRSDARQALARTQAEQEEQARQRLAELRKVLRGQIADRCAADPTQVDMQAVTLINSGVLNGFDYARLIDSAIDSGNWTMARLLSQNAIAQMPRMSSREEQELSRSSAARVVDMTTGKSVLQQFDSLADAAIRSVKNPDMGSRWEELTGAILS